MNRKLASLSGLVAALALLAGVAGAAPEPVGTDFRISNVGADGVPQREAKSPDVAYNSTDNEYLAVWDADGMANDGEYEIFGQRVSASGTELGPDFRISDTGTDGDAERDARRPAVAYNAAANEYLVVWESDQSAEDEFEIHGQRVSAAGVEEGEDFRISNAGPNTNPDYLATNPTVAYNSTDNEYVVVWHGSNLVSNEFDIWGQRISVAGAEVPDSTDFRISNLTAIPVNRDAFNPAIAYNPTANQYLAVWHGDGFANGQEEIEGQLLSAAGAEIGGDFRISEAGIDGDPDREALAPSLSFGEASNEYMVVWQADEVVDGEFDIYGQRVSAGGAEQGVDFRITEIGAGGLEDRDAVVPRIAYNAAAAEFLVTWQGDPLANPFELEVFAQRLSTSGDKLGDGFRVSRIGEENDSERDGSHPAVAYNSTSNEFLVAFEADGLETPNEIEIFGHRLAEVPPSNPGPLGPLGPPEPAAGKCAGKPATKTGTPGRDVIRGTRRRDVIAALGGSDTVRSLGGNDLVCGGRGKDRLVGGAGKDTLRGEDAGDTLKGGKGRDRLLGGRGRDLLRGGPARDVLVGGPGRDKQRQ